MIKVNKKEIAEYKDFANQFGEGVSAVIAKYLPNPPKDRPPTTEESREVVEKGVIMAMCLASAQAINVVYAVALGADPKWTHSLIEGVYRQTSVQETLKIMADVFQSRTSKGA